MPYQEKLSVGVRAQLPQGDEVFVNERVIEKVTYRDGLFVDRKCIPPDDLLDHLLEDRKKLKIPEVDVFNEICHKAISGLHGLNPVEWYVPEHENQAPVPKAPFTQMMAVKRNSNVYNHSITVSSPGFNKLKVFDSSFDEDSYFKNKAEDFKQMFRLFHPDVNLAKIVIIPARQDNGLKIFHLFHPDVDLADGVKIVFVPGMQQKNDGDCTIYAIINALSLSLGIDPLTLVDVNPNILRVFLAGIYKEICSLSLAIHALSPLHQTKMVSNNIAPAGWNPLPYKKKDVSKWLYDELKRRLDASL